MLYAIIAAVVIVFDQYVKFWVVNNIGYGMDRAFLPGIVHLTNVNNTGAAFSLFSDNTWLLTLITIVFIAGLIVYIIKAKLNIATRICVALVIGGAIGNLADRIRLGYVVDMFEVEFMNYAIFNVADCFIVVGVIAFCILYFVFESRKEKKLKELAGEKEDDSEA